MNAANDDTMSDEAFKEYIEKMSMEFRDRVIWLAGQYGQKSAQMGVTYTNGTLILGSALIEAVGVLFALAEIQRPGEVDFEKAKKDMNEQLIIDDHQSLAHELIQRKNGNAIH